MMARIIMADDDEIVGELAKDALTGAGHGFGLLTDGAAALRVIRTRRPDLVILDCNMPGLSGLLVLRAMRNSINMCETPVLILTGRQSNRDCDLAFFEGADEYMKKPFDPDELVFRVAEMLARRARATASSLRRPGFYALRNARSR